MNELQRIILTFTLIEHSEVQPRLRRLKECVNQAKLGDFKKCERLLLHYVSMRSVHAINRIKAYSILNKLASLQCLTIGEQKTIVKNTQITIENGN